MTRPNRLTRLGASLGAVATTLALGATLLATPVAAASAPITFDLSIHSSCIGGGAPAGSTVKLVWRDSTGAFKAAAIVDASINSSWTFCPADPEVWVAPRDRIKATVGPYTRNYVVPNLTVRLDRVNDVATGTGPASRTIRICSSWAVFGDQEQCNGVRVGQDGLWTFDPDTYVTAGWTLAYVSWKSPKGDHLNAAATAPQLIVTLGRASMSGYADPRSQVDIAINGGAKGTGHATADGFGEFTGQFRDSRGRLVTIAAGDHLSGPSLAADEDWIVPAIEATADRATDIVTGKCFGTGREVWLTVMHSGRGRGAGLTTREPDGTFWLDFHDPGAFWGPTNLISGDNILVGCTQSNGDIAQLKFTIP